MKAVIEGKSELTYIDTYTYIFWHI